ncbi:MAG: hypothetical protein HND53_13890 [Proteobacteria bacterium]|nr:hypothetical protein [Pseudomonadota bacterium]NOG61589.1 hypothetical protein [Pseudomonadota bacterium]
MNIVALLLFVMGLSMAVTATSLLISIRRNFLVGKSNQIEYLDKIEPVRFGRLLKKDDVNPQNLLHNKRITNIETQMSNCHACTRTTACGRNLNKVVIADRDLAFCPNYS